MFIQIAMVVMMAVVLVVVQAEVYAMLSAVAYARKTDGSLARKLQIGSARYEWASVIWHESSVEKPVYRLTVPLAVFIVTGFGLVAGMDYTGMKIDSGMAMLGAMLTSLGYFVGAYGSAFAAHRADIAEQQRAGTWQSA